MLERYRSFRRRFQNFLVPVFTRKDHSAPQAVRQQRVQRVVKVKDKRIDSFYLAAILDRRAEMYQVGAD